DLRTGSLFRHSTFSCVCGKQSAVGSSKPLLHTAYCLLEHSSITRVRDQPGVARQPAARVPGRRRSPLLAARLQLLVRYLYLQLARGEVDVDDVAVANQPDRAALGRLGRDVADAQAARAAAEAAIGDQGRAAAQLGDALDHAGQRQHLAHPRAATRAFVLDDDHVAGLDFAVHDGIGGGLLAVEDSGWAAEVHLVLVDRADF